MTVHECKRDGVMPKEFMDAVKNGLEIQVNTQSVVGWLTVDSDELEFRNGVEYRIKPKKK